MTDDNGRVMARKLLSNSPMPQTEKGKNKDKDRKSQSRQDSRKQEARGTPDQEREDVGSKKSGSTSRKGGKQPN